MLVPMHIECPSCDATYNIRPGGRVRGVRCGACGELITVPALVEAELDTEAEVKATSGEVPPVHAPLPATAASLVSILVGLVFVPMAGALGGGGAVTTTSFDTDLREGAIVGFVLVGFGVFALGFVGAGIGLWLRKAWCWWALASLHIFFLLINAKMLIPPAGIDYQDPQAMVAAPPYLLLHGTPIAMSLLVLVLLFLPQVRIFYGVKERLY
jgi:predicted Zn finger-like uncharacterized protein